MRIQLIAHASVLMEAGGCGIWTDPWLAGKVFNDSWSLLPGARWDDAWLERIDYLWISHEHPDHFHLPTLRALPEWFKTRVTILFQERDSGWMPDLFRALGFSNLRPLVHRESLPLTDAAGVYCYSAGRMDSCLAVTERGHTILDLNDARLAPGDCARIRADLGKIDALLTQFSFGSYSGLVDCEQPLRRVANGILKRIRKNHLRLGAAVTIPIASLFYFSSTENRYLNAFRNRPRAVFDFFTQAGLRTAVLYPGDSYEPGEPYDSTDALNRYDDLDVRMAKLPYDRPARVELEQIRTAFLGFAARLHESCSHPPLGWLKPLTIRIRDLERTLRFSIPARSCEPVSIRTAPDMVMGSQSLHCCFSTPGGFQTLPISGRVTIPCESFNLRLHRMLFALADAEPDLRPKFVKRNTGRRPLPGWLCAEPELKRLIAGQPGERPSRGIAAAEGRSSLPELVSTS